MFRDNVNYNRTEQEFGNFWNDPHFPVFVYLV